MHQVTVNVDGKPAFTLNFESVRHLDGEKLKLLLLQSHYDPNLRITFEGDYEEFMKWVKMFAVLDRKKNA